MSLVANTFVSPGEPQFIPYGATDAYVSYMNAVTISTGNVQLDGVSLDGSTANGGQLLINGVAVATVNQNVSSISNWATYPALSTINYGSGGGVLNTSNINAISVLSQNLVSSASQNVSSVNGLSAIGSYNVVNTRQVLTGTLTPAPGYSQATLNFATAPTGLYMFVLTDLNGNYGWWSASCPVSLTGGLTTAGVTVFPPTNGSGAAAQPNFNNYISITGSSTRAADILISILHNASSALNMAWVLYRIA
jgi:hypothetical protein